MESFFLWLAILLAIFFITYIAWKLIKYIAYNLSHAVARGIFDARNSEFIEKEKVISTKDVFKQKTIFSNREKQVRSDWRHSLLTYLLGSLAICFGCYLFQAYHDTEVANEVLMEGFVDVLVRAISTAIMFYFAYVKLGTKWIGWFVFVSPIGTALEVIKDLIETFSFPDLTITGIYYVLIVYLFSISLYVYFWIHCKQLYELNTSIKKRKVENEDDKLEPIQVV